MKTVPCDNYVTVTTTSNLRHLCPFKDEIDNGEVTITWRPDGETFELHALAAYLRGYEQSPVSHEAITDRIQLDLSTTPGVTGVRVETTWLTAGFRVQVQARGVVSPLRYFGNPSTPKVRGAMTAGLIDCIVTPKQGNKIPEGAWICADNGVYGKGYPGDDAWWAWLQTLPAERCRFAVAPDVVGDAAATLERSAPWLSRIRSLGIPAAFVAQDGQESLPVPWDEFDVLFIGGSTEWKLGRHVRDLVREAKSHGKWVHMGRVNSERRMRYASAIGCDSADGTYLAFGPDVNLPDVLAWLRVVDHPTMWEMQ